MSDLRLRDYCYSVDSRYQLYRNINYNEFRLWVLQFDNIDDYDVERFWRLFVSDRDYFCFTILDGKLFLNNSDPYKDNVTVLTFDMLFEIGDPKLDIDWKLVYLVVLGFIVSWFICVYILYNLFIG